MLVYCITNTVNNKKYIGITKHTPEFRYAQHIRESLNQDSDKTLHRAIRKYGSDAFNVAKIEDCLTKEIMYDREQYWIAFYDTKKNGYNSTDGGEGSHGRVISEETRHKLSSTHSKRFESSDARQKTSETTKIGMKKWWNSLTEEQKTEWKRKCSPKGRKASEETKEKIRQVHLGRKVSDTSKMKYAQNNRSEEWLANMSKAQKANYIHENNPSFKPEVKEKIRLARLGTKLITMPDGSRKYMKP